MAHNRSPAKIRSDVLASSLEIYRGWQIEVECDGSGCPIGRSHRLDALARHYPGETVGGIVRRLRCVACGRGPGTVVLAEVVARRRVSFRGPEVGY